MILVLLGTHELQFTRLLDMVEDCIDKGIIKEEVIVQSGNTKYSSDKMEIIDYLSYNNMESLVKKARYIITHGGTGSIITALRNNKKVIAIPRLKKYNEHNDDHQKEILEIMEREEYIKSLKEGDELGNLILELDEFEPKKFYSDNHVMIALIRDFIKTT